MPQTIQKEKFFDPRKPFQSQRPETHEEWQARMGGEVLAVVLPLPIPASVYGLMLLLAALRFGVVKLEQVRTAALFLTGIFPLLFVPAAAGVMDLWADLQAMLVPVLLALIPITILVMTVSGCVTQRLAERKEKKQ